MVAFKYEFNLVVSGRVTDMNKLGFRESSTAGLSPTELQPDIFNPDDPYWCFCTDATLKQLADTKCGDPRSQCYYDLCATGQGEVADNTKNTQQANEEVASELGKLQSTTVWKKCSTN